MSNTVLAVASLLIALTAIVLTLWQTFLQRKATQAQVFLHLLDKSDTPAVADGMELLATLPPYESYHAYLSDESPEVQTTVYRLVRFLNSTAILVEDGYVPRQEVWNLYFMDYRMAHQKLLPWWLGGLRNATYPQKFANFERMCYAVASVKDEDVTRFDRTMNKRLVAE
jgi:hypothetical protein